MASSQHRCVFVGNIPYDATEEQLIQICEEVGPVVSFRLVIDRETGKPKGYGFCEYKDEETALSARRNLQGYEINGRQLRVDFAENDKGADRNRDQGRGGPGMAANVGGPAILGNSALHQPIGLQVAMAASSVMAGALGGSQTVTNLNQNGQSSLFSDPLTLHLAKMSRNQLNVIMSELKGMAMQNKERARQLLIASPQLPKALFQAQIMLGMVTPQVLQMTNFGQPSLQDGQQQGQQPVPQTLPGLPPFSQNNTQLGLVPKSSEVITPPQIQLPQLSQNQGQFGLATIPTIRPTHLTNFSNRPQIQAVATSSSLPQPPLLQNSLQVGVGNVGHNSQPIIQNPARQPSLLTPGKLDSALQHGPSAFPGISEPTNNNGVNRSRHNISNLPVALSGGTVAHDNSEPTYRPSKQLKVDGGRSTPFSAGGGIGIGLSGNQVPKAEPQSSQKQVPQLPPEVESALLQQVMRLTPEQLSSLTPEQQQQVILLQQMLR